MKRSVKKLQKSTPALIVRPGIYGLGKAVNPGDVFRGCGFCDFTFFLKNPPTPFLWIQNNAANFPLPRDRHIGDIFPLIRSGFLPLGQAKLRSGHRGIERRGQDLRLGPGLGAREERGSSSAPLRVSLASKAPFPHFLSSASRWQVHNTKTSYFNVITCVIEDLVEDTKSCFIIIFRIFQSIIL